MVKLLLDHSVSPNALQFSLPRAASGLTALMGAAEGKSLPAAALLLARGADPAKQSSEGVTALQIAANENAFDIIELLLAHGVDVTTRNNYGHSALDIALLACSAESARILARSGAHLDLKAANSAKLLESALRFDCHEVVAGTLADGWSPDSRLAGGWPALAIAREFAAVISEELLRKAGAVDTSSPPMALVKESELDAPLKGVRTGSPVDPRPKEDRSAQTVKVEVIIDPNGHTVFTKVIDSKDRLLTAATITAVESWEFTKPVSKGNAVSARIVLPVAFKGPPVLNYANVSYRAPVPQYRAWPRFPVLGSTSGTEMAALMPVGGDGIGIFVDKPSEAGLVVLGFDVDANGTVKNIRIEQAYESAFANAAISALKQWSFLPGISGGRAVSMSMELQFRFAPPHYIWTGVPYRKFSVAGGKPAVSK